MYTKYGDINLYLFLLSYEKIHAHMRVQGRVYECSHCLAEQGFTNLGLHILKSNFSGSEHFNAPLSIVTVRNDDKTGLKMQLRFYRATLCVSAVFAVARCLSVSMVHCIHTAADIVRLFCRPGSLIILFLDSQRRYPIPREPLQREGAKIHGVGIFFCDFRVK